jgi:hypothetical protein
MIGVLLTLVLAADEAPPAASAPAQGQRWSVVGALTAGAGGNVVEGGLGWPGLSASYSRGLAPNFDLGVRISFNYALEGLVTRVLPGAKLQGLVKFRVVESGSLSVAFIFEPGPLFAVDRFGNSLIGLAVPVGLRMGLAVSSAITLGLSVDVPLWVQFGGGGGVNVPILAGLGLEYFIKSELLAFFKTRMGPTILPGVSLALAFDAHLGVGYRF